MASGAMQLGGPEMHSLLRGRREDPPPGLCPLFLLPWLLSLVKSTMDFKAQTLAHPESLLNTSSSDTF